MDYCKQQFSFKKLNKIECLLKKRFRIKIVFLYLSFEKLLNKQEKSVPCIKLFNSVAFYMKNGIFLFFYYKFQDVEVC